VKLPGFIAYDEEEYFADRLEEDLEAAGTDEDGKISKDALLRLAVTMRWRQGVDGGLQSNARLIEWSDGSLSLAIGPEQFEALPQKIEREQSYLFARHTKEGCMEAVGKVRDRLAVRPFVTAEQSHRKFLSLSRPTVSAATGLADTARVKLAVTTADPEREKQRMIKLEQERLKSKRKVEARRRNLQQRSYERVARSGLNARFLEEDEGEGDEEEDKYEDDFIDDTMKSGEDEEEEEEEESSEDASYAGSSDAFSSAGEAEDADSSEESEAVSTEGSASESEEEEAPKKSKKSKTKKGSKATPARKAAKIIDSDDD
jgi:RNA polymerase-associated protein LEO1